MSSSTGTNPCTRISGAPCWPRCTRSERSEWLRGSARQYSAQHVRRLPVPAADVAGQVPAITEFSDRLGAVAHRGEHAVFAAAIGEIIGTQIIRNMTERIAEDPRLRGRDARVD